MHFTHYVSAPLHFTRGAKKIGGIISLYFYHLKAIEQENIKPKHMYSAPTLDHELAMEISRV